MSRLGFLGPIFERNTPCISITTSQDSTTTTSEFNIFDEDNYSSYTYDVNSIHDITYTQSTGLFVVPYDGDYSVSINPIIDGGNDTILSIVKNGSTRIYSHNFYIHTSVDPVTRPITCLFTLAADDTLSFLLDGALTAKADAGTTVSIYKL